jgi:hypothetical protein
VIPTFFRLAQRAAAAYPGGVRQLRNTAAVLISLLAITSGATLAVASHSGRAAGDSGSGQYGTKPDCRASASKHSSTSQPGWLGCPKADR